MKNMLSKTVATALVTTLSLTAFAQKKGNEVKTFEAVVKELKENENSNITILKEVNGAQAAKVRMSEALHEMASLQKGTFDSNTVVSTMNKTIVTQEPGESATSFSVEGLVRTLLKLKQVSGAMKSKVMASKSVTASEKEVLEVLSSEQTQATLARFYLGLSKAEADTGLNSSQATQALNRMATFPEDMIAGVYDAKQAQATLAVMDGVANRMISNSKMTAEQALMAELEAQFGKDGAKDKLAKILSCKRRA